MSSCSDLGLRQLLELHRYWRTTLARTFFHFEWNQSILQPSNSSTKDFGYYL
jgi:hypothetical protein